MSTRTGGSLPRMARAFPARTGLYTVGPVCFALLQLLNCYLHGISLWYAGALAAVMLAYSVLVTGYHLATFRRAELSADAFAAGRDR